MSNYDRYCNIPGDSPFLGVSLPFFYENLPPAPTPQIQAEGVPANSVEAPEGFDPENPDLCELFNDLVNQESDPQYSKSINTNTAIPPFAETVYINCRIRLGARVEYRNYPPIYKIQELDSPIIFNFLIEKFSDSGMLSYFELPASYSQSSVYPGAEPAAADGMANGEVNELLQTVTNADSPSWIEADLGGVQYVTQIAIGSDSEGLLPGGFRQWGSDYLVIQIRNSINEDWTDTGITTGAPGTDIKYIEIEAEARFIRLVGYSKNIAITEFRLFSDRWDRPLEVVFSPEALIEKIIPSNRGLESGFLVSSKIESLVLKPENIRILLNCETLGTGDFSNATRSEDWHTHFWQAGTPGTTFSTSEPIFGNRSILVSTTHSNYPAAVRLIPPSGSSFGVNVSASANHFYFDPRGWHIKVYVVPATIGEPDEFGVYEQVIAQWRNVFKIAVDDQGYYFFEMSGGGGIGSQRIGGAETTGLEAENGELKCLAISFDGVSLSMWAQGALITEEPLLSPLPSAPVGYDTPFTIGSGDYNGLDFTRYFLRGGKIDNFALVAGQPYTGESDALNSPTLPPGPQPPLPQYIGATEFVGVNNGNSRVVSNSRSFLVPAHQAGDLLVAVIHFRKHSSEIIAPPAWTLHTGDIGAENLQYAKDGRIHIYQKVSLGNEPSSITWSCVGAPALNAGGIFVVRNGFIDSVNYFADREDGFFTNLEGERLPTFANEKTIKTEWSIRAIVGACSSSDQFFPSPAVFANISRRSFAPNTAIIHTSSFQGIIGIASVPGPCFSDFFTNSVNNLDPLTFFSVNIKTGTPIPVFVVFTDLIGVINVQAKIVIEKSTEWNPNFLNPKLWASSGSLDNFEFIDGLISRWNDQSSHDHDLTARAINTFDDGSSRFRPALSPPETRSGLQGPYFNRAVTGTPLANVLGTINDPGYWTFLGDGQFTVVAVAALGRDLPPGTNNTYESALLRFGNIFRLWLDFRGEQIDSQTGLPIASQPAGTNIFLSTRSSIGNETFSAQLADRSGPAWRQKAIFLVSGDHAAPAAQRANIKVNGVQVNHSRFTSTGTGSSVLSEPLRIGGNQGDGSTAGITSGFYWELIILDRRITEEEESQLTCYLAKEHAMTGEIPTTNPCWNAVANTDICFSESYTLPIDPSTGITTPAPVGDAVYSVSLCPKGTSVVRGTDFVYSESYCPDATIRISIPGIPATYSQSSVFSSGLYPPAAIPATQENMQNLTADETLATATNSTQPQGGGPWVMMDFGEIASFNSVRVGTDLNATLQIGGTGWGGWNDWYTTGAIIEGSVNGIDWIQIGQCPNSWPADQPIIAIQTPGSFYRYVRIGYPYDTGFVFAVTEFFAVGRGIIEEPSSPYGISHSYCLPPSATSAKTPIPATYSQSSLFPGADPASQANMQNEIFAEPLATITDFESAPWIMMDFGEVKTFDTIYFAGDWDYVLLDFFLGPEFGVFFGTFEASIDGTTWQQIAGPIESSVIASGPLMEFSVPGSSYRYVRFLNTIYGYAVATEFYAI